MQPSPAAVRRALRSVALAVAIPAVASAQLTVSGRVTDETGRPLPAASVLVDGTRLGTQTAEDGSYRLVIPSAQPPLVLLVRALGFKPQRFPIATTSGQVTQDARLVRDILNLSQLVVTATRAETERASLGASLATVSGREVANAGVPQVDAALAGKVPGALVQLNSGTPGGGTSVRLRGLSTISRSAEPLYIVDGVIVDNGSSQLVDLGGNTSNRIADLDPNDIERIEIVKGAAAAALYGSRANNGVVQIFTKRGRAGALRVNVRTSVGSDDLETRLPVNQSPVNAAGQAVTRFDYQDQIFQRGLTSNTSVGLSGGDELTQFFLGASVQTQDGIVRTSDYLRQNLRLNVDRSVTDWLRLSTSTAYVTSRANRQANGGLVNNRGVLTNFLFNSNDRNLFADPVTGVFPLGQLASNPLEVLANWRAPQEISRFTGGLQLTATPTDALTIDYRLGVDNYTDAQSSFVPRGSSAPDLQGGLAISANLRAKLLNQDVDVTYRWPSLGQWRFVTGVGSNYQQQQFNSTIARAENLALLVSTVQGSNQFASQSLDERRILGFYGQQQIAYGDLLTLTAALRSDASSAFGRDERQQYFPKFGASLDLTQVEAFRTATSAVLERLRLRGGIGFSGEQPPGSFDRLSNYVFQPAGTLSGVVNSTRQGNDGLRPERARELELGFDAEVAGGRLGVEYTRFDRQVTDLILPQTVTPSTGFTERLTNVGALRNRGHEVLLRSFNVQREAFTWSTTVTFATNDPVVTQVASGGAFFIPESFNIIRVAAGEAPGHFWGTTYNRDDAGRILTAAGQPIQAADGTITGIPAIGPARVIGNPNPGRYWSLINEFAVRKSVAVRVQFDGVGDVDVFNFDRRLLETPAFGVGAIYADELEGRVPRGYFAARRSVFEEYVEDGSFVKLREIALTWTLPETLNRRLRTRGASVTFSGRNLRTWTDYTGWDPETNTGGQRTAVRGFGFAAVPIPRSVALSVNLNY
jgi:TonB-dependent SusC/RagA subfamily outer membrane receptor